MRTIILLFTVLCTSICWGQDTKFLTYEDAFRRATEEDKVLIVILSAEYCAPCRTLKSDVFLPLLEGELRDCLVAVVDIEKQPELTTQLKKGDQIPQVVFYARENGGWKSSRVIGLLTKSRIIQLIRSLRSRK